MQNRQPTGICCMAQETQTAAVYQPIGGGEEVPKGGVNLHLWLIDAEV